MQSQTLEWSWMIHVEATCVITEKLLAWRKNQTILQDNENDQGVFIVVAATLAVVCRMRCTVIVWAHLGHWIKFHFLPRQMMLIDCFSLFTRLEWSWWYKTCRNSLCRYREATYWRKNFKTKKMAKMFDVWFLHLSVRKTTSTSLSLFLAEWSMQQDKSALPITFEWESVPS